jgi:two-component system LytT family response regulator
MKLNCIIVDDEPIAREGMAEDIRETGFIEIAGIAENTLQAAALLASGQVNIIFLDIEMPKINGLDFIKSLINPPMVIITTAYPEYALEGYGLDVIDYLLKPISFSRLQKACNKAREFYELKQNAGISREPANGYFFIKCNGRYEKIFLSELLFVEAADNYVTIHTTSRSFLTYHTLKSMQAYLPGNDFIKVHKSFIVAIDKIGHIAGNMIIINKYAIPISRNFKEAVLNRVVNDKMIRR